MTSTQDVTLRHLLDLCRRSEKVRAWQYSGFLSPAEQDDLLRSREAAGFSFSLTGGYDQAERKILAAGDEAEMGPPEPPIRVLSVAPKSEKFAEELTHRDYLGAILALGIERSLIGDILVRDHRAWFFCLDAIAELLTVSLTQVRRTAVTVAFSSADIPELITHGLYQTAPVEAIGLTATTDHDGTTGLTATWGGNDDLAAMFGLTSSKVDASCTYPCAGIQAAPPCGE